MDRPRTACWEASDSGDNYLHCNNIYCNIENNLIMTKHFFSHDLPEFIGATDPNHGIWDTIPKIDSHSVKNMIPMHHRLVRHPQVITKNQDIIKTCDIQEMITYLRTIFCQEHCESWYILPARMLEDISSTHDCPTDEQKSNLRSPQANIQIIVRLRRYVFSLQEECEYGW